MMYLISTPPRGERGQETEEEARRGFTTSEPRGEPAFFPNSKASHSMERDSGSGGGGSSSTGGHGRNLAMAVDNSSSSNSSSKLWEWKSLGQSAAKDLGSRGKKGGLDDDKKQEGEQLKPCTGLKLGKRTYFDDKQQSQPKPTTATATATTTTAAAAAPASNSPPKKGRSSPQGGAVPKCQVEGCTADLSGCKDYHRRHKVCEVHSKTPKNTVNGQEQRFCQQCSRFHLLSEFDEGKRSCRRRLAGHNERRRKPQPDVLAAYSMGNHSFQAAYQRFGPSILLDGHGFPRNSWSQLGSQLADNLSAEKLLLLLQNTKRTPASAAGSPSTVTPKKEQMGLLSLSPSPGAGGGGGGTPSTSRALSLLSAEPWTSSTNASASTTTTTTTTATAYHHSQVRPQQDYLMLSSSTQAQDAIPISSASLGSRAYASPMHHRLLSMDQQQHQQQGRIDLGRQPSSSSPFEQRLL